MLVVTHRKTCKLLLLPFSLLLILCPRAFLLAFVFAPSELREAELWRGNAACRSLTRFAGRLSGSAAMGVAKRTTWNALVERSAEGTATAAESGKVAIVTGASTGLGLATVQGLAESGIYSVIVLAGRDPSKHEMALASLRQKLSSDSAKGGAVQLRYIPLELDSLDSVRSFAAAFRALDLPLHVLVLNAGVMALPARQLTADGHEYQFAVNYLGHFLLANLLLDSLVSAASPSDPGRIVSLSSSAHLIPSLLQQGDTSDLQSSSDYSPWQSYGQAKLANLLFAYELDRRCRTLGVPISSNAVHPGAVATELKRHLNGGSGEGSKETDRETQNLAEELYASAKAFVQPLLDLIIQQPSEGARTTVLLATSEEGKLSGRYWQDGRPSASLDVEVQGLLPAPLRALRIVTRLFKALFPSSAPAPTSYDMGTWKKLWEESELLVGLTDFEKPSALRH